MSKVYVITSGKGGVGKTTTTANLGVGFGEAAFVAEPGHCVVFA